MREAEMTIYERVEAMREFIEKEGLKDEFRTYLKEKTIHINVNDLRKMIEEKYGTVGMVKSVSVNGEGVHDKKIRVGAGGVCTIEFEVDG